jgi:glycosyltransferase involved in cell wall biosynthesis
VLHRPLAAYARWRQRRREAEIVERAAATDLVYIAKVSGLDFYRRLKALGRPKIVADFNDGLWLPYYRNTGWQKLEELLGLVDGVVCENDYVAAFAARHNRRLFIVSDSPQIEVFDRLRDSVRRDDTRVVLGWIGSAENIGHLYRIFEPLEQLFAKHPNLHLRILGARENHIPRFEQVRWSCRPSFGQEDMVREILGCDIGLFPLFHIEDGRARGTLKAKVYMSGECVAVCENFGENPKLITHGENGMLADKPEEWHDRLEWLITHPVDRKRIARQGLETIQNEFTAPHMFRRLIGAFDNLVEAEAGGSVGAKC